MLKKFKNLKLNLNNQISKKKELKVIFKGFSFQNHNR